MILRTDLDAPNPGSLVGPWRVLERVGSGGNGIVYRACLAEDPGRGNYALKLAREPESPRFEREAEMLSRIDHPHVPRLVDRGTWQSPWGCEYPYLVMQWVEGVPLYRWGARHGITSRQVLQVLAQVARALEATHQHGVHRDVKGDNVLVTSDGHAVLLDYGCCWYEGARPLTASAVPPGTPPYRSPECLLFQYRFHGDPEAHYPYSTADDVYALGVTAYYLVTGTYPSREVDPEHADGSAQSMAPRRLAPSELATVLPELEAIILRMLSKKREERGAPGELAEAMVRAARSAGPEADMCIQRIRSRPPVEKERSPGKPRWHGGQKNPRWRIPTVIFAVMVLFRLLSSRQVTHEELLHHAEVPEAPEGRVSKRTVGLAEADVEGGVAAMDVPRVVMPEHALALPMPKNPFPGQRKPPCDPEMQKAINGGCWAGPIGTKKPPCGKNAVDYDDGCYLPVFDMPAPSTSEQP
jgi:serine/threonine protein kinase